MSSEDTKQNILSVALSLFSQKGYSAVSIRDICKQVGIKESTIYYHFKNKQDIFDTLQHQFLTIVNSYTSKLTKAMETSHEPFTDSSFEAIGQTYIEGFLLDDFCNAFMCALHIEKFGSDDARALYEKWMFESPLEYQAGIFSYLMKIGLIPQMDSYYLAVRYYAPIYLYYQRYLLSGKVTEEKKELFRKHVYYHLHEFMKE